MNFVPRPRFFINPPRFPMVSPWPPMIMRPPMINLLSNTRYHQTKEARYPPHRRSMRRISKTKSTSELPPQSYPSSGQLLKAHSCHSMARPRPGNFSVAYAHEMHLAPKPRRQRSRKRKKRPLPSSPKRQPSFRAPRKRPPPLPERGVVRISTFDELPLRINPRYKRKTSVTTDRLSAKGSVTTNSMKGRARPTKVRTRPEKKKNRSPSSSSSSSSSISTFNSSLSSAQRRLNGSLRSDPHLSAAMEDFRRFRRQSESSVSPSHSQSSFTSVERCEIRQLVQKMKTKETTPVERPASPPPIPPAPPSERSVPLYSRRSVPSSKPRKSSLTEELDREFSKLRSLDPDQELSYVIPSAISKRKKPIEIRPPADPPLPTFTEMLRQVQLRPIDKSSINKPQINEKPSKEEYRSPVPVVAVPQSSPTPPYEPPPAEEVKHEYARPMKKPVESGLLQICHFQPMRHLGRSKSSSNTVPDKRHSRSLGMFNRFPVTFQPTRSLHPTPNSHSTSVNENIYTPDIPVHLPLANNEEQITLTDYYYSESDLKDTGTTKTSFFRDLTRVFSHKHEQKIRLHRKASTSRCSLM